MSSAASDAADMVLVLVAEAALRRLPGLRAERDELVADIEATLSDHLRARLTVALADVDERIVVAESHAAGRSPDADAISRAIATPDVPWNPYGPGPVPTKSAIWERGVRTQ